MEITPSYQNGGDSSVFDSNGQKPSSYTSAPSFGPSLHQQRITNQDQIQNYVPSLSHNSMSHNQIHHPAADSQIELVTALKIRIAVLENDLAHASKDKDEAIRSSVIIARALGNVANSPELVTKKRRDSDTEELEELRVEVKRLRRENGLLWGRIESRESGHMVAYGNSTHATSNGNNTYQVSREDSQYPLATNPRSTHPIIDAAIKKISVQDEPKQSHHPFDFNGETQLPNIVNLEQLEDGSLAVPLEFSALPSTPKKRKINDINNSNLDDVLASSDEEEPELKIEDQLLYQERANANFVNVPPPAVLRAGFEVSPAKAIRGDDYANRGYANRNNYYARFNNRNTPTGPRSFEFPPDLSEGTTIWATPQQRDDEINSHMRASDSRDSRFPDYFRFGVVYVPKEGDHDTLRGVHIGGLPKNIELRDVLARVRGGRIYSSVLLNTMAISGSNSALVTFINQADAECYVKYANDYPITFGSPNSYEVHTATVTHIHTPTFPFSPGKFKSIFELNRTRILTVRDFPQQISLRRLETDLSGRNGVRAQRMLEWYLDEEGTLRMEFCSMDAAGSAFGMLSSMNGYREYRLELQFEKDSCEGELEELEKEIEKRKPMFPRTPMGTGDDRRRLGASGDGEEEEISRKVDSVLVVRKRLAALQKQHDVIPSLRGANLKSSSWADEVIEESEDSTPSEEFGCQTEANTSFENDKVSQDNDTLRPQPHQRRSIAESESTLIGPSTEAPRKDEDASIPPVTPRRGPRIITGKQWLLELAAKEQASPSTPAIPNPPAPSPSTPNSNEATPKPRLTVSTALPPKTTSKSPEPSSAEYSLHSFASSAVSDGDGSPQFKHAPVKPHTQAQASTPAPTKPANPTIRRLGAPIFSAAGHPVQIGPSAQPVLPSHPAVSNPTIQVLKTFGNTIKNADTKVYFVSGADNEKAILDSEVSSQRGGDQDQHDSSALILKGLDKALVDQDVRGGIAVKVQTLEVPSKLESEEKTTTKINPDEIDLDLESDGDGYVEGDENDGLFQKELSLKTNEHAESEMHSSDPPIDDEEVTDSKTDAPNEEEVRGRKLAARPTTSTEANDQ